VQAVSRFAPALQKHDATLRRVRVVRERTGTELSKRLRRKGKSHCNTRAARKSTTVARIESRAACG